MKYTLITGASSGIGYELAIKFANNGHNLILVARNKTKLEELRTKLLMTNTIDIVVLPCDLCKHEDINALVNEIEQKMYCIDILCNNAGIGYYGPFLESKLYDVDAMIDLNICALTKLTYNLGNKMKENGGGTILNIASVGSFVPGPMFAVYYATKAYVLSFSEALSVELKPYNVDVCAVCPGPTNTNFFVNAGDGSVNLLKSIKPVDPRTVSDFAYSAIKKKKVVAIPCFKNKASIFFTKHLSRKAVRKIMYKIQMNRVK